MHNNKTQFILNQLYRLNPPGRIELTLDRIKRLLKDLGNPEKKLKNVIIVGGTNGKGSTIEFLRSILSENNYSVNVYTSPHVLSFNERINFNGKYITDKQFEEYVIKIDKANNGKDITFYEYISSMAFLAFYENPADFNLIEVGLGGVGDCAAVFEKPVGQILTPISLDHLEYLGPTIEDIVKNKTGIIKEDTNLVISRQKRAIQKIIDKEITKKKTKKYILGEDFQVAKENNRMIFQDQNSLHDIDLPKMNGDFQLDNASTAIKMLKSLNIKLDNESINKGIVNASIIGRIQIIHKGNLRNNIHDENMLILDGSHNEDAGKELSSFLEKLKGKKNIYMIFNMLKSKNIENYLKYFSTLINEIKVIKCDDGFYEVKDAMSKISKLGIHVNPSKNVSSALSQFAIQDPEAIIVISGSFRIIGKALELNK